MIDLTKYLNWEIYIAIGFLLGGLIFYLLTKIKKRHSLKEIKGLIKQSNNHLIEAAKIQVKLYKVFNEIEGELR